MQKAAAVMQWKLEARRSPGTPSGAWSTRRLLRGLDLAAGNIRIDGKTYPLKDTRFPTLDPARPEELSIDEQKCLERLRKSFLTSQQLAQHIRFLVERGSMWLCRDDHLLFHGCVPADEQGRFLPLGRRRRAEGRARPLRGARARRRAQHRLASPEGPRSPLVPLERALSPCFGEGPDHDARARPDRRQGEPHETKNPYFSLIHEAGFCDRVLAEFGADPARGLIVNGHVPVQIEKGESPIKAQREGDHDRRGVLAGLRRSPATRSSSSRSGPSSPCTSLRVGRGAAVRDGVDIIPTTSPVRDWAAPRPRRGHGARRGDSAPGSISSSGSSGPTDARPGQDLGSHAELPHLSRVLLERTPVTLLREQQNTRPGHAAASRGSPAAAHRSRRSRRGSSGTDSARRARRCSRSPCRPSSAAPRHGAPQRHGRDRIGEQVDGAPRARPGGSRARRGTAARSPSTRDVDVDVHPLLVVDPGRGLRLEEDRQTPAARRKASRRPLPARRLAAARREDLARVPRIRLERSADLLVERAHVRAKGPRAGSRRSCSVSL